MTELLTLPKKPADTLPTGLSCAGCGYVAPRDELPLRCPGATPTDDIDHVLRRTIDATRVEWPRGGEANPFVRYRTLFHGYQRAIAAGRSDAELVAQIDALDGAIAAVDGRGFRVTPLTSATFDGVTTLIKDETHNVSGSHKARHLFGTLLELRLAEGFAVPRSNAPITGTPMAVPGSPAGQIGSSLPPHGRVAPNFPPGSLKAVDSAVGRQGSAPLAIASCGNAALAAAVVARAAGRELLVFVPTDAEPAVLARLAPLGATVTVCERRSAEQGDPTVLRMREALANGAIPFTCQGNENGLAIEGGLTLGYELADQWRETGKTPEHLFVQVGGGALASSVIQALQEAMALGALTEMPRIHAVQTTNTHPLARAFDLVQHAGARGIDNDKWAWIAGHRSDFMWPWESVPHSIAGGILDDETYDWLAVVRGMLASRGRPVLVDEPTLAETNRLARETTGIDVDHTGSAGLAGMLELRHARAIQANETCQVLFTGANR